MKFPKFKTNEPPISYEEACRRVRAAMRSDAGGYYASNIADMVWPNNTMKPQGAAFAVGKFLSQMRKDGIIGTDRHARYVPGPNFKECGSG